MTAGPHANPPETGLQRAAKRFDQRAWPIVRRVLVGTWNDGFIHAGNLAYMSMLAIFPFFILGGAIFSLFGEEAARDGLIDGLLIALPDMVQEVVGPVAHSVIDLRSGWLLWVGAAIALWTVSSLIETIRDIMHRAYRTPQQYSFWRYRLFSAGMIIGAVVLMLFLLIGQVLMGTAQEVIFTFFPGLNEMMGQISLSRAIAALGFFVTVHLLFHSLAPEKYRKSRYPAWPGAVVTTLWWLTASYVLPPLLSSVFVYSLTYGSLAGIMITLFFFWFVGLGVVIGAELNAALAKVPEEQAASEENLQEAGTS